MLSFLERSCFLVGAVLIVGVAVAYFDRLAQHSTALETFHAVQQKVVPSEARTNWSDAFTKNYEESIALEAGETIAVLRIDALDIEVPVFGSTDEVALNRGTGHIAGTTLPGERGNVAIAGHRDGFFRKLKDIEPGMSIRLLSLDGWQEFEVTELSVVDPLDIDVLAPDGEPRITLVTCYPFYYVGPAPDRFIVTARLVAPTSAAGFAAAFNTVVSLPGDLQ